MSYQGPIPVSDQVEAIDPTSDSYNTFANYENTYGIYELNDIVDTISPTSSSYNTYASYEATMLNIEDSVEVS